MDMPWGWLLEYLLDAKKLPFAFLQGVIAYVKHIEEPQCSRLLQKVALRYLDEATVTRKLDSCDVEYMRFLVKEQGVSDLRRVHSLKESFQNDLTLRVETEAVLTNLRCSSEEGTRDWAAFKDAIDCIFAEDVLEPRAVERRKELTAVLPEQLNGDLGEQLCKQLLEKYPEQELFRDLTHFVDDKRNLFKIKFLDQLAKDFESGVYSVSPRSESSETQTASRMPTDLREDSQVEDRTHLATALPGSTPVPCENDSPIATAEAGGGEAGNPAAGAKVISAPKDVQEEISFRMAEVDEVKSGLANDLHELKNDLNKFTEDISHTASMPFATPDLSIHRATPLAGPIVGSSVAMHQKSVSICTGTRAEGNLAIDKPAEEQLETRASHEQVESHREVRERHTSSQPPVTSGAGTSRLSPETIKKRLSEISIDQDTDVAKKRKLDDAEGASDEYTNQSTAPGENREFEFRPVVQTTNRVVPSNSTLSSAYVNNVMMGDSENWPYDLPAAGGGDGERTAKCSFCGSRGGSQAVCHRCSVSMHEHCLSEICRRQVTIENCWHCFTCIAMGAQEGLRRAQEVVKEAEDALRKAEEELITSQERLANFLSAKRKRSGGRPAGLSDVFELNKGTTSGKGKSIEYAESMGNGEGSTEQFTSGPGGEDRNPLPKDGTAERVSILHPTVQNTTERDTIGQVGRIEQEIVTQTAPQVSVLGGELHSAGGNHGPDPGLAREKLVVKGSLRVPSLPVSQGQGLAPADKRPFGDFVKEPLGGPRISTNGVSSSIPDTNHDDFISGRLDVLTEGFGTPKRTSSGSRVTRSQGGNLGPKSEPLLNSRSPEGDEGDGHDGDLEEVCEATVVAAKRDHTARRAVRESSETKSEPLNVGASLRRRARQTYSGRREIPGIRRKYLPWTQSEEDALKEGVNMFSKGGEWGFQWKRILDFGGGKFDKSRTTIDLKDKWRNIQKTQAALSEQPP